MACLPRIFRNLQLNRSHLVRTLTSNVAASNGRALIPLTFTSKPVSLINVPNNSWIWQRNEKIEIPKTGTNLEIGLPNGLKYILPLQEPSENKDLELPAVPNQEEPKEAVRMIVIRKNKMKRHKLKKLRKRMKFEYAKRRQRREWNKEKAFQAVLIAQCKEAEAFSAEKYVAERLAKFKEVKAAQTKHRTVPKTPM